MSEPPFKAEDYEDLLSSIDAIEDCKSKSELLDTLSNYLSRFDVNHVTMGLILNPALVSHDVTKLGVSNFPGEFYKAWVDDDLIFHDPILTYALRSKSAFGWREAYNHADRYGRRTMDRAAETGLQNGYVVPIFGPKQPIGMVSLALEHSISDPNIRATIEIPIIHAYGKLLTFLDPVKLPQTAMLTSREVDVLHYVAAGKTNWEIGVILNISENTVKKIIKHILRKYGTSSRTHAVALAIRQGLLLP